MIEPLKKNQEQIKIYIVFELINDVYYDVAHYSTFTESIDFVKRARQWEERWKDLKEKTEPATEYKIIEFQSEMSFVER